jgi:hypothetical protein
LFDSDFLHFSLRLGAILLRVGADLVQFWRVGAAGMSYIRKSQILDPGSAVGDEN